MHPERSRCTLLDECFEPRAVHLSKVKQEDKMEKFYVIQRSDGYIFIQHYVPQNYGDGFLTEEVKFTKLGEFADVKEAAQFAEEKRGTGYYN